MGAESDQSRAPWSSRLLGVIGYLGLTPLLCLFLVRRHDNFVRHHQAQALATLLPFLLLLAIWPIWLTLEVYLVRDRVQTSHIQGALTGLTIVSFGWLCLWGLIWIVALGMAIAGSTRPVPFVAWLARRPRLVGVALICNSFLLALVGPVIGLAIHAASLVREDAVPAPVYYLYDNRDHAFLGTWGQKLFCYRVARAAQERWGPGSAVVAPLTVENFRTAVTHGRFVVLIGHGARGAFTTSEDLSIWPDFRGRTATPGTGLQFVYMSACHGGDKQTEWEPSFAPTQVVTFDRDSAALEHLWWLLRIPVKVGADSARSRALIPLEAGHLQSCPASDLLSVVNRILCSSVFSSQSCSGG